MLCTHRPEPSIAGDIVTKNTNRTALVTGASSGLGFEAAAQLAEAGYGRVIITARSKPKAARARSSLQARTAADVFETLIVNLDNRATIATAIADLGERGRHIDVLLLNAGLVSAQEVTRTDAGIESTVAATLIGHHVLTMGLLDADLLSDHVRIVIAGSEAARGDVPTFNPIDIPAIADAEFDGDTVAAIEGVMRMDPRIGYHAGNQYATTKLFAAWWAAELARQLPAGMTVNAVSPGSTPDTDAGRNAPFFTKRVMLPMLRILPGMSHSVADGAGRYLEAADFGPDQTGIFFASKPKKMTGPLHVIEMDYIVNPGLQRALWDATTVVSDGVGYPADQAGR